MTSIARRLKMVWIASFIILFCGVVFMVPNCSAENQPEQVVIGYQPFPTAELVVKDFKWNETSFGVPVKWVTISSGMQALDALTEKKLDIALLGSSPAAAAIARGIPIDVIWIHDIIGDNEALVVRDSSNITDVAGLVGKKVAVPYGSTTHYHLIAALRLSSIKVQDVDIVYLEPDEITKVWQDGGIDAAFVWVPNLTRLLDNGGRILLTSRQLAERGFPTGDLCVVRKEFGEKNPEIVVEYLNNLNKAVKYCRTDTEEAAQVIARQLDISPSQAKAQLKGAILLTAEEQDQGKYFGGTHWNFGLYNVVKETADFLKEEGIVESLPPRDTFLKAINGTYLMEVLHPQSQNGTSAGQSG